MTDSHIPNENINCFHLLRSNLEIQMRDLKSKASPDWCGSVGWVSYANWKVGGLRPSQGTCLGCRPGPCWGCMRGN